MDNTAATDTQPEAGIIDSQADSIVAPDATPTDAPADTQTQEPKKEIWSVDGDKATTNDPVELGVKYTAPQNDQVTVTFTKLPDNPGKLSIEEITLTDEQVTSLNALSDKAYDITSDMADGTFEYSLTLPKPADQKNVQIKYAEGKSQLDEAKTVSDSDVKVGSDKVSAKLDHFTIFILVAYETISSIDVTNPNNVFASDDKYALFDATNDTAQYYAKNLLSNTIPSTSIINGIEVLLEEKKSNTDNCELNAYLWNVSSSSYTTGKNNSPSTTESTVVLGSATSMWGKTWTPSDFNTDNFKIKIDGESINHDCVISLDQIQIKIYYSAAPNLTAHKSNNVNGSVTTGNSFVWTIKVSNIGTATASFKDNNVLLEDEMPGKNVDNYTDITVTKSGVTGNIGCSIKGEGGGANNQDLKCEADGDVSMPADSNFTVSVTVHPEATGTLTNPVSAEKICKADVGGGQNGNIDESNESDNNCNSDSVIISSADTTAPTLNLPADITAETTSPSGAVVTYTATADDIDPAHPAVTCVPPSGSTFPLGTTSVACSATDAAGNTANGSFNVTVQDTTKPVITLDGSNPQVIIYHTAYAESGATASDNYDPDFAVTDIDASDVNVDAVGFYTVKYNAVDSNGNHAVEVTRTVEVRDTGNPVITLIGVNPQVIEAGVAYVELGANVADNYDAGLIATINSLAVDTATVGSYSIYYNAVDTSGNPATQVVRTVNVVDTTAPVITLVGDNPQTIELGSGYTELGATTDDGSPVTINATDFINAVGSYFVYYDSTDGTNVAIQKIRTVNVVDTVAPTKPVIIFPANEAYFKTTPIRNEWTLATDDSGIKEYRVEYIYDDGHTFSGGPYRVVTTTWRNHVPNISEQGGVTIRVQAIDNTGNESEWSDPVHYYYDATPPTVDLVFPTPGYSSKSFQAVFSEDVNAGDAENPANYFLNNWPGFGGSGDLAGDATIDYDSASKTATINFTASGWYVSPEQQWGIQNIHDLAGNLQSVNAYTEYSTPMVDPETTASLSGALGLNDFYTSSVTVNFSATDGDATVGSGVKATHYSVDGAGFVNGLSALVETDGEHTVLYYSEDNAGNTEDEKSILFKIDKTAPTLSANPPAGDYYTDQSVELSGLDAGSGLDKIYYTLDGTTPDNTKTEYAGAITVDKDMTIKAIAYDKAGNASGVLEAAYGIAPNIYSETVISVTTTSATINWTTDDSATSRVVYGTISHPVLGSAPNYDYANSTVEDPALTTSHSVIVSPLVSGTNYYFRAVSHGSPEAVSQEITGTTATELGTITISKHTNKSTDKTFTFTPSYGEDFVLASGKSNISGSLVPGIYTVKESKKNKWWDLKNIICTDAAQNSAITISGSTATIDLAAGADVTCVFNDKYHNHGKTGGGGGGGGGTTTTATLPGGGAPGGPAGGAPGGPPGGGVIGPGTVEGAQAAGPEEVAGAQTQCSEWPLWVWILLMLIYAGIFNALNFFAFERIKKARWFGQAVALIAGFLVWYWFDKCRLHNWFPYALGIVSIASFWYYLRKLREFLKKMAVK